MLATCPACGANGHGRLTAVIPFLAVAHQVGIAVAVIHRRCQLVSPTRAAVHHPQTSREALIMGHLVRVHVATSANQIRRLRRRCIERSGKGGGSGGSDTSPNGMHDSPGNITGGSPQEGMRRLLPVRRGLEFRVHTTRQESLDAPAVARRLLPMDAGNVPSVRSKRARVAYCSHPTPRSSTPGRHHSARPPSSTH